MDLIHFLCDLICKHWQTRTKMEIKVVCGLDSKLDKKHGNQNIVASSLVFFLDTHMCQKTSFIYIVYWFL